MTLAHRISLPGKLLSKLLSHQCQLHVIISSFVIPYQIKSIMPKLWERWLYFFSERCCIIELRDEKRQKLTIIHVYIPLISSNLMAIPRTSKSHNNAFLELRNSNVIYFISKNNEIYQLLSVKLSEHILMCMAVILCNMFNQLL